MHESSTREIASRMSETGMMDLQHNIQILSRTRVTGETIQLATSSSKSETPLHLLASYAELPEIGQDVSPLYGSVIRDGGLLVLNSPGDTSACQVFIINRSSHGSSLKYASSSDAEIVPPREVDKDSTLFVAKGTRLTTFIANGIVPRAEDRVAAGRAMVFSEERGKDSAEVMKLYQRVVNTIPEAAAVLQAKEITISPHKLVGWLERLGMRTELGMRKRPK